MTQTTPRSFKILSSFVFCTLCALLLGACDSTDTSGAPNDATSRDDSSANCEMKTCDEFEKPPESDEYESPASKISVDSRNFMSVAVEPRPFMRPDETGRLTWLHSDEAAVIDASFLIDPSDAGSDLEPREFVMYAFVNFEPAPFGVVRAASGKEPDFATEKELASMSLKKVNDVEFNFDQINNYSVRIPPTSLGETGTKVVNLVIAEANPENSDRPWNSAGSISRALEVHFGSEADWRGSLPSVRAPNTHVTPALASSTFRTKSLIVPRPPVYEQPTDGSDEELNLNQTFNATSDSINAYNYLLSISSESLKAGRIVVTYLKNRDQVVGGSPIRLDADPLGDRDETLRIERTFDASGADDPLRRLESVRFFIPDRKPISGERANFGNMLNFE